VGNGSDEYDYQALFSDGITNAWDRCLALWRPRRRVEDKPRNLHLPRYRVSREKWLGRAFAEEFRNDYSFLVEKLSSPDLIEAACAHDVLVYIFENWEDGPDPIQAVRVPIPAWVMKEIENQRYKTFRGTTLGELFRFERDGC
jgi:hypothetical protein